jgi:hypothetical protein
VWIASTEEVEPFGRAARFADYLTSDTLQVRSQHAAKGFGVIDDERFDGRLSNLASLPLLAILRGRADPLHFGGDLFGGPSLKSRLTTLTSELLSLILGELFHALPAQGDGGRVFSLARHSETYTAAYAPPLARCD